MTLSICDPNQNSILSLKYVKYNVHVSTPNTVYSAISIVYKQDERTYSRTTVNLMITMADNGRQVFILSHV